MHAAHASASTAHHPEVRGRGTLFPKEASRRLMWPEARGPRVDAIPCARTSDGYPLTELSDGAP